jgi:hypothetical protein
VGAVPDIKPVFGFMVTDDPSGAAELYPDEYGTVI